MEEKLDKINRVKYYFELLHPVKLRYDGDDGEKIFEEQDRLIANENIIYKYLDKIDEEFSKIEDEKTEMDAMQEIFDKMLAEHYIELSDCDNAFLRPDKAREFICNNPSIVHEEFFKKSREARRSQSSFDKQIAVEDIVFDGIEIGEYLNQIYPDIKSLSEDEKKEREVMYSFIKDNLNDIQNEEREISENSRKSRRVNKSPKVKSVERVLISYYREILGIENDMESQESLEMMSYIKKNPFKVHRLFSERKDDRMYKILGYEELLRNIMSDSPEKIVTTTEVGKCMIGAPTHLKAEAGEIEENGKNAKDKEMGEVRDDN